MSEKKYGDGGVTLRLVKSWRPKNGVEEESAKLDTLGLSLPEGLPYDTWEGVGRSLGKILDASPWWAGDWLNYGERAYGESYSQAMDATGLSHQTLYNYASVASAFPLEKRRAGLKFGHHDAVASLMRSNPDVASEILDRSEEEGLSVPEVRWDARTARVDLGLEPAPPPVPRLPEEKLHGSGALNYNGNFEPDFDEPKTLEDYTRVRQSTSVHGHDVAWLDDLVDMVLDAARAFTDEQRIAVHDRAYEWANQHGLYDDEG